MATHESPSADPSNVGPRQGRGRSTAGALLAAMRPRQWTKNLVVFAALVLTLELGQPDKTLAATLTFWIFCAVSSAVYLINDLVDIESDRRHPVKQYRPLAAGELSPSIALVAAIVLAAVGIAGGFWIRPLLGWVVVAYLLLQLSYSFYLKQLVIIDALALAGGFVLRVLAGGAAIDEPISSYLYLSVVFLALFQGFAKRRHELQMLADDASGHRQSLDEYTTELLDHFIMITASATIVTYSLYAITTEQRPASVSSNLLLTTVPFVIYAIFRYMYLVYVRGLGGAPEEILLKDRPMQLAVLGWGASLLVMLYGLPSLLDYLPL